MNTASPRYLLLLTLLFCQQGAFAVAFHDDLDPDHLRTHGTVSCDEAAYLAAAATALPAAVPVLAPAAPAREQILTAIPSEVAATTPAFRSRAPPTLP